MDFVGGDIIVEVDKHSHRFTVRSAENDFPPTEYATWESLLQTSQSSKESESASVTGIGTSRNTFISQHPKTTVIVAVCLPVGIFLFLVCREGIGERLSRKIAVEVIKRLRQPGWEFTRFGLRALVRSSYDSTAATALQPHITVDSVVEQAVASLVRDD